MDKFVENQLEILFYLKYTNKCPQDPAARRLISSWQSVILSLSTQKGAYMSTTALGQEERIVPRSQLRHRPISISADGGKVFQTIPRASRPKRQRAPHATDGPPFMTAKHHRRSAHWLLPVGPTMTGMVLLILLLQFAWGFASIVYDDLTYGRPRTTQIDAAVGHQDSAAHPTHILALNLRGQIHIIELLGGDAQKARIFVGPHLPTGCATS